MTTKATKNYEVIIAGLSYRLAGTPEDSVGTQVAVRGEVIELDAKEAERLERQAAIVETDKPTSASTRVEAVPVEHAQEQESKEAHAAKTRRGAKAADAE